MKKIAQKRLHQNLKKNLHYLTLIFNDFFILALFFLFGAFMYAYSALLKQIPANLWLYKPVVAVLLSLLAFIGHLATLFQSADSQFLLTQDEKMPQYLSVMHHYSMLFPTIVTLLFSGLLFPFALIKGQLSWLQYGTLVLSTLLLKYLQLGFLSQRLFFDFKWSLGYFYWVDLGLMLIGVYNKFILLPLIVISFIAANEYLKRLNHQKRLFNWRFALDDEARRLSRVYTFYSLFTDVSEREIKIRRRQYLDFLLPRHLMAESANTFLYRRALLRNPVYLNLLTRMSVFAILLTFMMPSWGWLLAVNGLTIFLTLYQLLPLRQQFNRHLMYRTQPMSPDSQGKDLVRALGSVLYLQWGLISLIWLMISPQKIAALGGVLLLLIWEVILQYGYLPQKLKKRNLM